MTIYDCYMCVYEYSMPLIFLSVRFDFYFYLVNIRPFHVSSFLYGPLLKCVYMVQACQWFLK